MRGYGKHYVVYNQESYHNYYELNPEAKVDIYGIYTSLSKARKALKDCVSVAEDCYEYTGKTVSCRIVDEPDTVVIVKDWITNGYGVVTHNPRLITIRIEREL